MADRLHIRGSKGDITIRIFVTGAPGFIPFPAVDLLKASNL
jgi:hypothetical protein